MKQELCWTEDERSIGILEEDEEGNTKYSPVILYNIKVIGNINDQHNPYRGWEIRIKTTDGNEFDVVLTTEEVKSFKTFHRCVTEQTWGADLS